MINNRFVGLTSMLLGVLTAHAQPDTVLLALDEHYLVGDAGDDPSPDLNFYEAYNSSLGGDSVRLCGGHPCIGWVEDHYPNGTLKHRGSYADGRLLIYRNYHPNGQLEREFKAIDATRSVQRSWHANGNLRSETHYADGAVFRYEDHYLNGQLRYAEERGRRDPYFVRLDLFAADGTPISLLSLVDKRNRIFEQKEYHPGGALKATGRSQYNEQRMDTQRIGTWTYYDPSGAKVREEDYIDGKVHVVR
jgi:antitoxin component YwqK of YwqJK toxin-antitoxin module